MVVFRMGDKKRGTQEYYFHTVAVLLVLLLGYIDVIH